MGWPEAPARSGPLEPLTLVSLYTAAQEYETPLYLRTELQSGDLIEGPAIIIETNATTVVEPGWQAQITPKHHLLMSQLQPLPRRTSVATDVDPVRLEIFNNLFMAVAEQMGVVLANTAHSVNIKERLDHSCAIFDAQGRLAAQAEHIPVHLGSLPWGLRQTLAYLRAHGIMPGEGDMVVLNDPYIAGTHLNDITLVRPIFHHGALVGYAANKAHHDDVGGGVPGSMNARAPELYAEGLILPVRARPGARRSGVVGEQGGALKVAVTAPPQDGRANLIACHQTSGRRVGRGRPVLRNRVINFHVIGVGHVDGEHANNGRRECEQPRNDERQLVARRTA